MLTKLIMLLHNLQVYLVKVKIDLFSKEIKGFNKVVILTEEMIEDSKKLIVETKEYIGEVNAKEEDTEQMLNKLENILG